MSHKVDIDTIIRQAEDAIFGDNRHGRDGAEMTALVNLGILYQLGRIADALEAQEQDRQADLERQEIEAHRQERLNRSGLVEDDGTW